MIFGRKEHKGHKGRNPHSPLRALCSLWLKQKGFGQETEKKP
jgi:hypothetical protein